MCKASQGWTLDDREGVEVFPGALVCSMRPGWPLTALPGRQVQEERERERETEATGVCSLLHFAAPEGSGKQHVGDAPQQVVNTAQGLYGREHHDDACNVKQNTVKWVMLLNVSRLI